MTRGSGVQPIQSASELCRVLPGIVSRLVGAPNGVVQVLPAQRQADDTIRHVEGMFLPSAQTVVLRSDLLSRIDQFLQGASNSTRLEMEERNKWMISMVKGDLAVAIHEIAHGFGPVDRTLHELESDGYWKDASALVFNEGFCEVVSREFLDNVVDELGLHAIDARIAEVPPIRQRFVGPYTIVDAMIRHVSETHGVPRTEVIKRIAARGGSLIALWNVAALWGEGSKLGATVVANETLQDVLGEFTATWLTESASALDTAHEEQLGHDTAEKLGRSITRAVTRYQSRNEVIDVALLGELIASAGKAASAKTTHGFDAMAEAMNLMELGEF